MKLIISKATVVAINAEAFVAFTPMIMELDPSTTCAELKDAFGTLNLDDTHANHSVTEVDGDIVMEINDELLFKYMRVYAKIARVVTPFVKPFMALIKTLSEDFDDIQRFITLKK